MGMFAGWIVTLAACGRQRREEDVDVVPTLSEKPSSIPATTEDILGSGLPDLELRRSAAPPSATGSAGAARGKR